MKGKTSLLKTREENSDSGNKVTDVGTNKNNLPKRPVMLKRMESKVSMFAPEAINTEFNDVPVLTICPHCRLKVVTKTGYDKGCCSWCCCVDLLFLFKDIHHTCPKCNQLIAKYNRLCVTWGSKVEVIEPNNDERKFSQSETISEEPCEMSDVEDERSLLLQRDYNSSSLDLPRDLKAHNGRRNKRFDKTYRKSSKT